MGEQARRWAGRCRPPLERPTGQVNVFVSPGVRSTKPSVMPSAGQTPASQVPIVQLFWSLQGVPSGERRVEASPTGWRASTSRFARAAIAASHGECLALQTPPRHTSLIVHKSLSLQGVPSVCPVQGPGAMHGRPRLVPVREVRGHGRRWHLDLVGVRRVAGRNVADQVQFGFFVRAPECVVMPLGSSACRQHNSPEPSQPGEVRASVQTAFVGRRIETPLWGRALWQWLSRQVKQRARAADLRQAGIALAEGDLLRPELPPPAVRGVDAVVHCAAFFRGATPEQAQAVNELGTQHLASAARAASVKRFVFTSTGLVYGSNRGPPGAARMTPARRRRPTR